MFAHHHLRFLLLIPITLLTTACNSDSDGLEPENFDGTWSYISQTTQENCGDGLTVDYGTVNITQIAGAVTIFTNDDNEGVAGRVNGHELTWRTPMPMDGGTARQNGTLILSEQGNSARGEVHFAWSKGGFSCSGSHTIEMTCQSGLCLDGNDQPEAWNPDIEQESRQKLACYENYPQPECKQANGGNSGTHTQFDFSRSCASLGFEQSQLRTFSGTLPAIGTKLGTCAVYSEAVQ